MENRGTVRKDTSCSFRPDPASGNACEAHRAKGQSSSPAPNSKAKTDGEIPSKSFRQQRRTKPFRQKGAESRADVENVIIRHVIIGTLPCVKITSPRQDAHVARNAFSCRQNTHPRAHNEHNSMFTITDGHICAWLKAQGSRLKTCTHRGPRIKESILQSSMSSPCWFLPHLLSHSPPQHEAPPGEHDLLQKHSTHPAQLPHHDFSENTQKLIQLHSKL